jgi:hypothetical protein
MELRISEQAALSWRMAGGIMLPCHEAHGSVTLHGKPNATIGGVWLWLRLRLSRYIYIDGKGCDLT